MAKEQLLEMDVRKYTDLTKTCHHTSCGHDLIAYSAGKMRKSRIHAGNRVSIELSPHDLHKGRIIFRHRNPATGMHS